MYDYSLTPYTQRPSTLIVPVYAAASNPSATERNLVAALGYKINTTGLKFGKFRLRKSPVPIKQESETNGMLTFLNLGRIY